MKNKKVEYSEEVLSLFTTTLIINLKCEKCVTYLIKIQFFYFSV